MVPSDDDPSSTAVRHTVVIWVVLLGLIIGAFATTVIALNSSVYSAGGFVNSYLVALQRHDLAGALATPGVLGTTTASSELLTPAALGEIDDVSITSDVDQGGGLHYVSYTATLDGSPGGGTFQVQQGANRFGVFSTWSFIQSPMSVLRITPLHDANFAANGVEVTAKSGPSIAAAYQVLTPGVFTLTHDSGYLTATPTTAVVTAPGSTVAASLDIQASPRFVSEVQKEVDAFLDDCTKQQVLFPTGCPFGQELSNRVESVPAWSMSRYPEVTIEPGSDLGTWVVPKAQGAAHLKVDVRSLFDGTLSTFDEDVQFALTWVMTLSGDRIDIQAQ
ncbi:hypothetical protein BKA04_001288 [Cryobacterium mesophilum]|uniref:Uncharacterized protein n=1 Tax=Terrimesophilobacter mesophilus TaxID=433647 RepID=A0A4R8VDB2_9MICO|nr:hypothetical protein [Terrimesophilobacter mesophilus]MBB5633065.1 hypothetical protein [Terrimesophilobacter mesophilus]TFB79827.1 hypothetical protein E3N84_07085 [Terrimesophilobacter mesophilus]